MRKYVTNEDLSVTLDKLVKKSDPALIKIYAQLYCYHENPKDKKLAGVGKLLDSPKRLVTSVINCALMVVVLALLPRFTRSLDNIFMQYSLMGLAIIVLWLCLFQSYLFYKRMQIATDYILVDELISRGIVKLKRD